MEKRTFCIILIAIIMLIGTSCSNKDSGEKNIYFVGDDFSEKIMIKKVLNQPK